MLWTGSRTRILWISFGIMGCLVDALASNVFYNVTCASDTMVVMLNLRGSRPWPLVYLQNLKSFPGCEPEIRSPVLIFRLKLNDTAHCGLSKMLNKQTGYSIFYHRIVIEVPGKDLELLVVQCVIPGDFNMDFVRLDWQRESLPVHNYTTVDAVKGMMSWNASRPETVPYLQMSIRDRGTRIDTSTIVQPGSLLDLLIYLEKHSSDQYGLSLRYLTLTDTTRSQEEVIVMNGCSVDPYVIQVLRTEDGVLKSQFRAFKFQSSDFVIFLATINVCLQKCVEVECFGPADSNGRRKREIPRYLPHYKNEIYEVEIAAFLRLKADVPGDIIREESTNETLDALYESAEDYPYIETADSSNTLMPTYLFVLCSVFSIS